MVVSIWSGRGESGRVRYQRRQQHTHVYANQLMAANRPEIAETQTWREDERTEAGEDVPSYSLTSSAVALTRRPSLPERLETSSERRRGPDTRVSSHNLWRPCPHTFLSSLIYVLFVIFRHNVNNKHSSRVMPKNVLWMRKCRFT